jgi:hypothetical protein
MFPTLIPISRRPRRPQKNDAARRAGDSGAEEAKVRAIGARGGAAGRLYQPMFYMCPGGRAASGSFDVTDLFRDRAALSSMQRP